MKASLRTFLVALFLFSIPFFAHAATRAELLAKIEELREIVRTLTAELRAQLVESNKDFSFDRNLSIGSRGADVERLQLFLSLYTQFYPEGFVTGYYGELTSAAVDRLKREYGIEEVGFGESARTSLNDLMSNSLTPVISTPSLSDADDDNASGVEGVSGEVNIDVITHEIHNEINRTREKNGLNALGWDDEIAAVALAHAEDQARDNQRLTQPDLLCQYPTIRHEGFVSGYLVRDRVQSAKIDFRSVGENIAMIPAIKTRSYSLDLGDKEPECPERTTFVIGQATDEVAYQKSLDSLYAKAEAVEAVTFIRNDYYTASDIVRLAVDGWMDSPGHRENILYPDYTHGGVGIVKVNEYYIITHDLVGR